MNLRLHSEINKKDVDAMNQEINFNDSGWVISLFGLIFR